MRRVSKTPERSCTLGDPAAIDRGCSDDVPACIRFDNGPERVMSARLARLELHVCVLRRWHGHTVDAPPSRACFDFIEAQMHEGHVPIPPRA
jgi:hypothetical protein